MKNLLIVTAHPSSKNLTKEIAKIYKQEKENQGYSVEILDLYQDKQLPFLSFENPYEIKISEDAKYYQDKIKNATEILIVYPFWWGSMPAILKNWIDSVFRMGFAATYNDKGRPVGLLQGKSVRIITTSGAPKLWYCITHIIYANKTLWKKTIVKFCGMGFDGFHLFGSITKHNDHIEKIFDKVKKLANK